MRASHGEGKRKRERKREGRERARGEGSGGASSFAAEGNPEDPTVPEGPRRKASARLSLRVSGSV